MGCQVGIAGTPLVMAVYRCVLCLCRIRKESTSAELSVEVLCDCSADVWPLLSLLVMTERKSKIVTLLLRPISKCKCLVV